MGIFEGMETAKAAFDQNYIRPGRYFVRIDRVKQDKNRQKEDFVAVETTVLRVIEEQFKDGGEGEPKTRVSHRVGENPTWMQMHRHDGFLGRIKRFVSVAMDCSPDDVGEPECERMVLDDGSEDAQPMAGLVLEVSCREAESKKGTEIHPVTWVRVLAYSDLKDVLEPDTLEKYYPGDTLEKLIEIYEGDDE